MNFVLFFQYHGAHVRDGKREEGVAGAASGEKMIMAMVGGAMVLPVFMPVS